jgi:hypothetical protein
MNLNGIRSVLTLLAGALPIITVALGCSVDALGTTDCSGTWVPAQYVFLLSGALGILSFVIKAFGQGGTITENVAKPSVVVTPESKPGTVTPAQVDSTAAVKV